MFRKNEQRSPLITLAWLHFRVPGASWGGFEGVLGGLGGVLGGPGSILGGLGGGWGANLAFDGHPKRLRIASRKYFTEPFEEVAAEIRRCQKMYKNHRFYYGFCTFL